MNHALVLLAAVGASAITSQSELFAWLRRWGERIQEKHPLVAHLTTCMMCQGFWWGLGLTFADSHDPWQAFLLALAASGLAWLAQHLAYWLQASASHQTTQKTNPESLPITGSSPTEGGLEYWLI